MKVRYEKSFEKDLKAVNDMKLLKKVKGILDEIKNAENLQDIRNIGLLSEYETY